MTITYSTARNVPGYSVLVPNIEAIKAAGLPELAGHGWCTWKAEGRGREKPAKVPCRPDGRALSVALPDTWLSFEDARAAYATGGFDGVGLLMASAADVRGGLVGLDLDKCLASDGSVVEGKEQIVDDFLALGGYVEISPSGSGLRQFLRGVTVDDYKQNSPSSGLEIYDTGDSRYLTLTGVPYPIGSAPGCIVANQAGLEAFTMRWAERLPDAVPIEFDPDFQGVQRTAAEVLLLLRRNNKRGRITRLLAGDLADYGGGHSEADLALCCEIAYYVRDPAVIDEILRGSGLMREKWDSKRGRETYGGRTIREALRRQTRNYDADQVAKVEDNGAKQAQGKVADEHIIGGVADLKTRHGWKRDIWALSEMLLRDRRLLGVAFWDEFSGFPILTRSLREALGDQSAPATVGRFSDDHYRTIQAWFGRQWGISIKREVCLEVVGRWSQAIRRNPAVERLTELETAWDGVARLDDWLLTYCAAVTMPEGGPDVSEYIQAVGTRWVLGVVARAFQPGAKADAMLILEGRQGARKSSAVRVLSEAIGPEYFREGFHLGEGSGKDSRIALRGRLVIEWAELSGMGRRDRNELKNFLTLQTDSYRSVYGMVESDWPRTAVFCGTTNDAHYLTDPSGNRRFWPVKVRRIDLDALRRDAGQIWGEAVARWRAGARWWFDDADPRDRRLLRLAESEQGRRISSGMWEELGADLADKLVRGELPLLDSNLAAHHGGGFSGAQMRAWLDDMAEGGRVIDDVVWLRVADGLRRAGWESYKSGCMRWRLTPERRADLCAIWEVDQDQHQSMSEIRAEHEASKAMAAARAKSVISHCETRQKGVEGRAEI